MVDPPTHERHRWGWLERTVFVVGSPLVTFLLIMWLGSLIARIGETSFGILPEQSWLYVFVVAFVGGVSGAYAIALVIGRWSRRSRTRRRDR